MGQILFLAPCEYAVFVLIDHLDIQHTIVYTNVMTVVCQDQKVRKSTEHSSLRQVMSKDPINTTPTTNVVEAARKMFEHKISTLPVMDSGNVVGIITESVLVDICIGEEP